MLEGLSQVMEAIEMFFAKFTKHLYEDIEGASTTYYVKLEHLCPSAIILLRMLFSQGLRCKTPVKDCYFSN